MHRQIGEAAAFKQTDVSDADQVQALVDFAVERFGGLDIMFNNAGIGSPLKRFLPDDLEDFSRIMNVNLFGVIVGLPAGRPVHEGSRRGIHHQQRLDRRHQRRQRHDLLPGVEGGHRPCLASAWPSTWRPTASGSTASRRPTSAPASRPTRWDRCCKYMQPLEREAQPEDVANAVVFLSSDRAAQITGDRAADRRRHHGGAALCADQADHVDAAAAGGRGAAHLIVTGGPCHGLSRPGVNSRLRRWRPRRKKVGRYS